MTRKQRARVLRAGCALDGGLEEVSGEPDRTHQERDQTARPSALTNAATARAVTNSVCQSKPCRRACFNQQPTPSSTVPPPSTGCRYQLTPDVPRDLEKIVNRCLRKEPERRFQHIDDVRVALLELRDESASGRLDGATAQKRRRVRWAPWTA